MSDPELLVTRSDHLGSIRLNRPEALNSLTLDMVRLFTTKLEAFAADPSIYAVLVDGAGTRGLCAGGDIRRLFAMGPAGHAYFKTFWREEYQLNARIAAFPKPYVVIMDGVTMGGGIGISAHGNRRIVTERSRLAMPETSIGFIPDVGGTWLLARKGGVGFYLALSGVSFGSTDAIHFGFADTFVDSTQLGDMKRQLALINNTRDVDVILERFSKEPGEAALTPHIALLDHAMRHAQMEEIIEALLTESSDFARHAAEEILSRSPTSLKVTHELLKRAAVADRLEDCLVNEFRAAVRLLESHDLYEGIRAAIIEKDRCPRWSPPTLAGVDDVIVRDIVAGAGDADPQFEPFQKPDRERMST